MLPADSLNSSSADEQRADAVGGFVVGLAGMALQPAVLTQLGERLVGQLPRGVEIRGSRVARWRWTKKEIARP